MHRRGLRTKPPPPSHEEQVLRGVDPALSRLVDVYKKRDGGRALRAVKRLYRFYLDYPTETLVRVVRDIEPFGLTDLARIERLVLEHIGGEFFRLNPKDDQEMPP